MDLLSLALFPQPASSYKAEDLGDNLIWLPQPRTPREVSADEILDTPDEDSPDLKARIHGLHKGAQNEVLKVSHQRPVAANARTLFAPASNASDAQDSVPALYLPAPFAKFTVLYLHENRAAVQPGTYAHGHTGRTHSRPFGHTAWSFQATGVAPVVPTADSVTENARCGLNYLRNVLHIPNSDIIVFGRSIGTGAALAITEGRRLGGVVLVSGFTGIKDCIRERAGMVADLFDELYPNLERVKKLNSPLLVVHGKQDTMVDWSHSKRLFDGCRGNSRLVLLENLAHNGSLFGDFRFTKAMVEFFLLPAYNFKRPIQVGSGASMSDAEAAELEGYLPLEAPQGRLLRELRPGEYLVTTAHGFAMVDYRCSKEWENRSILAVADGSVIRGEDVGDGWVRFRIGQQQSRADWAEDPASDSDETLTV